MTNVYAYGVIRCARNVRRRREARARRVRRALLILAAAVMCWMLSGCGGMRNAEFGGRNAEFGMRSEQAFDSWMAQGLALQWCAGALLLVGSVVAIVLAVRKTAANDRECGMTNAGCGPACIAALSEAMEAELRWSVCEPSCPGGLDAAELGRIVGAREIDHNTAHTTTSAP